jgi:MFS family permease
VAPVIAGQIADRWWPAQRLLSLCAIASACVLMLLATLTSPGPVFTAALVFWALFAPAMTLGTVISFSHLADAAREFGRVRVWGTVGWVAVGWIIGGWLDRSQWLGAFMPTTLGRPMLADMFRIGAAFAMALAVFAFFLPHTPPMHSQGKRLATWDAIRALRGRAMLVYGVCVAGVSVTMPFTSQLTPLLLSRLGASQEWMGPLLTVSQSTEIVALFLLPMFLTRLGVKGTLALGLIAWALALVILVIGEPLPLVIASLPLNGLCICCFFVAGQVLVNSRAPADVRASAQALVHFLIGGGMLGGHLLAGIVRSLAQGSFRPTFALSASLAVALAVFFLAAFPADDAPV